MKKHNFGDPKVLSNDYVLDMQRETLGEFVLLLNFTLKIVLFILIPITQITTKISFKNLF